MSDLRAQPTADGAGEPIGTAGTATSPTGDLVIDLRDDRATDAAITGGKAAALARAGRAGLDALPGVVLTTAFAAAVDGGAAVAEHAAVDDAFRRIGGATTKLIARSSSIHEDTAASSMAGQFDSVGGIDGPGDLEAAVQVVLDSRARVGEPHTPIAVLVQPLLEPALAGVLFGVDPVTGRSDRRVISAVASSPEPLVSGEVSGSRYVLDLAGHVVDEDRGDGPRLSRSDRARLAALSARAAEAFGGPQDVEWAIDTDGRLWLLQSRPVTTEILGVPSGPVYGPGPVAETFPEPLTELEVDLWVPPLREAVRAAVELAGAASPKEIAASEVVVVQHGHVAIDLLLAGDVPRPNGLWQRLNPVPAVRRLRGAWRVGRLRAALPRLAEHLLERTDTDLRTVPPLEELTERQLVALMHRSRDVLRALHAHEMLMGMLTDAGTSRMTGASVALRVLAEARGDGVADDEIVEHFPVVLAVTAPRIAARVELPPPTDALPPGPLADDGGDDAVLREALRLRVRWVQELSGRAAWELGARLERQGDLPRTDLVRHLTLDQVDAIATHRSVIAPELVATHHHDFGDPLPARFRRSDTGHAVRVQSASEVGSGTGAGGGSGRGVVTHDADDPPLGSVLVVTTLTPGLGPLLARLHGIVAETGSVLSHLAILAREAGVATVVGYADAVGDLPEGTVVLVDGDTGRVTVEAGATDGEAAS